MNTFTKVLLSVPLLLSTVACSASSLEYKTNRGTTVNIEKENVSCGDAHSTRSDLFWCKAYGTETLLNGVVRNWSGSQYCGPITYDFDVHTYNKITCQAVRDSGVYVH